MAISKERLELLIKDGGTIFYLSGKTIEKKVLKHKYHEFFINEGSQELVEYNKKQWIGLWEHKLSKLFETKEDAKWHKEFGCIERTQTISLPTWEQIENIIEQKKKFGLNHSDRVLARIITGDSIYYLKLCKDLDLFTFQLKQTYIGDDLCEQITTRFPYMFGIATKENYILACRKAKELFLGKTE